MAVTARINKIHDQQQRAALTIHQFVQLNHIDIVKINIAVWGFILKHIISVLDEK
jgi:hypothetical protein